MKKKILAAILCSILAIGTLAGCSKETTDSSTSSSSQSVSYDEIEYNALDYVSLGEYKGVEITLNAADYEVTDKDVEEEIESQVQS